MSDSRREALFASGTEAAQSGTGIVHAAPAQASSLMLIGHNPGLEDLLCHLATRLPGGTIEKFPTCALAVLDFPVRHWSQLNKKGGTVADYVTPRDY